MTAALRSLYRRLVRRAMLARGVRPCRIWFKVYGSVRTGVRADVMGWACWWAAPEDVDAELRRAWRSARRQFARRHGLALSIPAALKFTRGTDRWTGKEITG